MFFLRRVVCGLLALWVAGACAEDKVLGQPGLLATTAAERCLLAGKPMFESPSGVAIAADGRLFVADAINKRILTWVDVEKLDGCTPPEQVIGLGLLSRPESLAFDEANRTLYVADSAAHVVLAFRQVGLGWVKVLSLGTPQQAGNLPHLFNTPRGLAVDDAGRLYVADQANGVVKVFEPGFYDQMPASVQLTGFYAPQALLWVGKSLFISDSSQGLARVWRFVGGTLRPPELVGAFEWRGAALGLAWHPSGTLWVGNGMDGGLLGFDDALLRASAWQSDKALTRNLSSGGADLAVDRRGRVLVADPRAFRVVLLDESLPLFPITAVQPDTPAARWLQDLHERADAGFEQVMLAQELMSYDSKFWDQSMQDLRDAGIPRLPSAVGANAFHLTKAYTAPVLTGLLAYANQGYAITLSWTPKNPFTGNEYGDLAIATSQLEQLVDDSTVPGQLWQQELDALAKVLRPFEDAGVAVLLRPLADMNSPWNWWGHDGSEGMGLLRRQVAFIRLWRDLVVDLSQKHGLHNLLFNYSTDSFVTPKQASALDFFPGAAWVDVVGIDVLQNSLFAAGDKIGEPFYAALLKTSKPFALSEFGQTIERGPGAAWDVNVLSQRITQSFPRTVLAMSRFNAPPMTYDLAHVSGTGGLLTDRLFITKAPPPPLGVCGAANGVPTVDIPQSLCATGTPSAVQHSPDMFSWQCLGLQNASCQAPRHYRLSVQTDAGGRIDITPAQASYAFATPVVLSVSANQENQFYAWEGACTGSEKICRLDMRQNQEVKAQFVSYGESELSRLYLSSFLRGVDFGGMQFWQARLDEGQSLQQVAGVVFSLPTVLTIYPASLSDEVFVEAIYRNTFNRPSDPGGMTYWKAEIAQLRRDFWQAGSPNADFEARGALSMRMVNAALGAPLGAEGRAYVENRYALALYVAISQRELEREIPPTTLLTIFSKVNDSAASLEQGRREVDTALQ